MLTSQIFVLHAYNGVLSDYICIVEFKYHDYNVQCSLEFTESY